MSNIETKEKLTKSDLRKIWYRQGFFHLSSMSYEKLQGHSYAFAYIPFAKKYYKNDPEGMRRLLKRHSMFFNTEPQTGQIINGIVASLEEEIALGGDVSEEMPVNIKTTLMGPIAGIADSIIQGIIIPVLLSISMGLATGGSVLGPLFYIVSYLAIGLTISYVGFNSGYRLGVGAIDKLVGDSMKKITDAFNVLGVMVIGGLAASYTVLNTTIEVPMGEVVTPLQEILNGFFPGLLPLTAVMFSWWLISRKQVSATKVIFILTGICFVGVLLGIL